MSDIDNLRTTLEKMADSIELAAIDLEAMERLALKLGASSEEIDNAKQTARNREDITSRVKTQFLPMRRDLETLCRLVFAQDQMQDPRTPPKAN
jgi:hypothetical protein